MPKHLGPCWIALTLLVSGACSRAPLAPSPTPTPSPPPTPPATTAYVGTYAMTLAVGERCALPQDVRTRTYTAAIGPKLGDSLRIGTLVVTLKGAAFRQNCGRNTFVPVLGCNQFVAWPEGDRISFSLANIEFGDGGFIWELLPGGDLVLATSYSEGRLEGSTIEASGNADLWYGATSTYCSQTDYRLTFTPR